MEFDAGTFITFNNGSTIQWANNEGHEDEKPCRNEKTGREDWRSATNQSVD
jgi:hypothetical protein